MPPTMEPTQKPFPRLLSLTSGATKLTYDCEEPCLRRQASSKRLSQYSPQFKSLCAIYRTPKAQYICQPHLRNHSNVFELTNWTSVQVNCSDIYSGICCTDGSPHVAGLTRPQQCFWRKSGCEPDEIKKTSFRKPGFELSAMKQKGTKKLNEQTAVLDDQMNTTSISFVKFNTRAIHPSAQTERDLADRPK